MKIYATGIRCSSYSKHITRLAYFDRVSPSPCTAPANGASCRAPVASHKDRDLDSSDLRALRCLQQADVLIGSCRGQPLARLRP